jgi:hypothetical protein
MLVHTEGHEENLLVGTQIQSLTMSGPLDGALESASCWPSLVSLCPSLCLLCAALIRQTGFAFERQDPQALRQLWGPFWIRLPYPVM